MVVFKKYSQDRSGTAAIEFALVSSALVTLTFGIFESGRLILSWNSLQYALENATRFALIEDPDQETLAARIAQDMQKMGLDADSLQVAVGHATEGTVEFIEVQGSYGYSPIVPFLPESWDLINLTANTRFPIQTAAASGEGDGEAEVDPDADPGADPADDPADVPADDTPVDDPADVPADDAPADDSGPGNGNGNGNAHGHK